jgi:DNA-binding NtrC family response regulator
MMHEKTTLDGLRVLVVEDDFHVAESLSLALRKLGCTVVGPTATAEEACAIMKREDVDAAVLDVRLSPGTSEPIARALASRGRPFVFVTGYSSIRVLPDDLRGHRVLAKPVDQETLGDAILELLNGTRH